MADPEYENDTDEHSENEDDSATDDDSDKPTLQAKKIRRSSNGKWKLYYEKRVFRKEWEETFPWVEEDPEDPKFAICRACNKKIKAHKGILETHQKTKRHLKNLSGSDDLQETPTIPKQEKMDKIPMQHPMEQVVGDEQISFFAESSVDAAHQAITNLIDKLVEKYHENRLENLKVQNEAMLALQRERSDLQRAENQRKLERRLQQEAYSREAQEAHLKFLQVQHDTKISAMEDERDAKLHAIEQELMFARQEYEKKVRLLDIQLSSMK